MNGLDLSKLSNSDLDALSRGDIKGMSNQGLEFLASLKPQQKEMTAGEVATTAITNIPRSAVGLARDIYTAVTSPLQTAKTVLDLGAGILQEVLPQSIVQAVGEDKASRQVAQQVGKFYVDRYGSVEGAKKAIAEDPVGVLADAATILYGGGAAMKAVPATQKIGAATQRAGSMIDPLAATARGVAGVTRATIPSVLGMTTGAGGESIRQAFKAGQEGGERGRQFRENLTGTADPTDIVAIARQNLDSLRQQNSEKYRSGMLNISKDKSVLSFDGIDKALLDANKRVTFEGKVKDKAAAEKLSEAQALVNDWKNQDPSKFHTPEGLDALKQSIGAILDTLEPNKNAYNTVNQVYNSVKSEIVKQAPVYANTMRNYSQGLELIREVEKSLSIGNKSSVDTALRKLLSLTRDNVQTNYGQRTKLAQQLEEAGGQMMMPGVAGQALQSKVPRGLSQITGGGLPVLAALGGNLPQAVGMAAISSPRLMGETAYRAGQVARGMDVVGQTAPFILTPELYNLLAQSGETENRISMETGPGARR
jgi:hypothetical protein